MGAGYHGGFGDTEGKKNHDIKEANELIKELEKNRVKFTKEDIIFITKDKTGQIIWLEKGNPGAGLKHILNGNGEQTFGHIGDFKRLVGIEKTEIPGYIKKVMTKGEVISNKVQIRKSRECYERIYYYEGTHYLITAVGKNGFIVSAYPSNKKIKEK